MTISNEVIEQIIRDAGAEFDSHEIILKIAQQNQRSYVAELAALQTDTPFQTFHSMLGKRIKAICEQHGYVGEASRSQDIFGHYSNCVFWSRNDDH
ncbi:hypothetical protein ACF3M1_17075 [Luteimonas sp. WGS1318]|uniref:hypothetical protein n=1 Tax=Luteimonas sp. WGS1318 TaxID=3366815 RepID=UPI00372D6F30